MGGGCSKAQILFEVVMVGRKCRKDSDIASRVSAEACTSKAMAIHSDAPAIYVRGKERITTTRK